LTKVHLASGSVFGEEGGKGCIRYPTGDRVEHELIKANITVRITERDCSFAMAPPSVQRLSSCKWTFLQLGSLIHY